MGLGCSLGGGHNVMLVRRETCRSCARPFQFKLLYGIPHGFSDVSFGFWMCIVLCLIMQHASFWHPIIWFRRHLQSAVFIFESQSTRFNSSIDEPDQEKYDGALCRTTFNGFLCSVRVSIPCGTLEVLYRLQTATNILQLSTINNQDHLF